MQRNVGDFPSQIGIFPAAWKRPQKRNNERLKVTFDVVCVSLIALTILYTFKLAYPALKEVRKSQASPLYTAFLNFFELFSVLCAQLRNGKLELQFDYNFCMDIKSVFFFLLGILMRATINENFKFLSRRFPNMKQIAQMVPIPSLILLQIFYRGFYIPLWCYYMGLCVTFETFQENARATMATYSKILEVNPKPEDKDNDLGKSRERHSDARETERIKKIAAQDLLIKKDLQLTPLDRFRMYLASQTDARFDLIMSLRPHPPIIKETTAHILFIFLILSLV